MAIDYFSMSADQLIALFEEHSIPHGQPGFCDHPKFISAERRNAALLTAYSAFVAKRQYSPAYLESARAVIRQVAELLHGELLRHGRLGACIDMSMFVIRILEQEGIWSCGVKGSLTIQFAKSSRIGTRYFWSIDRGEASAGHAWVVAPPFAVVDITLKQQPYESNEAKYLPELVLSESRVPAPVFLEDVVSPEARDRMRVPGMSDRDKLQRAAHHIPSIFESFAPIAIEGGQGAQLKYTPVAIFAPDGTFEQMSSMEFDGLSPWELYRDKLHALIANR